MANQPTHNKLFFTRTVRIRKEHISGQQAPQGPHDIMLTVHKGEVKNIRADVATDLIIAKTCIRADVVQNEAEMTTIRSEVEAETKRWEQIHADEKKLKKAA